MTSQERPKKKGTNFTLFSYLKKYVYPHFDFALGFANCVASLVNREQVILLSNTGQSYFMAAEIKSS